ncbi:MAG: DNA methyltransferase [Pirellulaceae bacterium]
MTPQDFIDRWKDSGGAEMANSQSFLKELCDLLEVPQPSPTHSDESHNTYVFEKAVQFNNGDGTYSTGRVDLYRQGCFVLESKQGSERKAAELAPLAATTQAKKHRVGTAKRGTAAWNQSMTKARGQAKRYAEALPEWPPLLVVVDVGHCFDLYADFSLTGKNYVPFPDPKSYRIELKQLADDQILDQLKALWLDPHSLDPSRRAAQVTRDLAAKLAELAKRLEAQPKRAAGFNPADHAKTDNQGKKSHSRAAGFNPAVPLAETDTQGQETHARTAGINPAAHGKKYTPDQVSQFLMRCLFTMFAEDVELLGVPDPTEPGLRTEGKFTALLKSLRSAPQNFVPMVEALWQTMNTGGFSVVLRENVKRFNGGLFEDCTALPVEPDHLELLIESAEANWSHVEPAIFGTLLERALDPHERHKLGAHFTPRAYVDRLVMPTLIEPLREAWDNAYATAVQQYTDGDADAARKTVRQFHGELCETHVLDPACGSGNFLYVALELMKRLEGEVLNALLEFGEKQRPLLTIDPHQFLGIEVNPRAAAITDLVLWIGYLQWHFRTRGREPLKEPIIRKFHNIECRDAVLDWDAVEPVIGEDGQPVSRWDGRTTKPHPVTGEEVPDETARVEEVRYLNPRKAEWPKADFIVGNPPFIGTARMRYALGDGYTEAIRKTYSEVPESCDYVMYWWKAAAELARSGGVRRFGFIATNSLRQTFNRRVLQTQMTSKPPLSILFAIPDHPWVDAALGAAVRISMTVAEAGSAVGRLLKVAGRELPDEVGGGVPLVERWGDIQSDLTIGANVAGALPLQSNTEISGRGVTLFGSGFIVTREQATKLGLGKMEELGHHIREYRNGRDITQSPRGALVIDLLGLNIDEVRQRFPEVYQWVLSRVKPERDQNNRASYRDNWWIHGEPRRALRPILKGLSRYITTVETSKYRFFVFLDHSILPDNMLVAIGLDDPYSLGILSSSIHATWALAVGGRLGVGNDPRYNKTRCFETFPFPETTEDQKQKIRDLAEQLDAHRKRQQEKHSGLTMTGMYNVLEKLRAGEALSAKEQTIHEQGLVSVLKQIHDDLDAAVAAAYGWPAELADEEILVRLVELNHQRAEEEARGIVRWLRPEFQNPSGPTSVQQHLAIEEKKPKKGKVKAAAKAKKNPWPKTLPQRVKAVRDALTSQHSPVTVEELATTFSRAKREDVQELLETLVAIGQARQVDDLRYAA